MNIEHILIKTLFFSALIAAILACISVMIVFGEFLILVFT